METNTTNNESILYYTVLYATIKGQDHFGFLENNSKTLDGYWLIDSSKSTTLFPNY